MSSTSRKLNWLLWPAVVLTILVITLAFILERWHANSGQDLLKLQFPVPDFVLTNQHGQVVTRSNLLGNVWVADIVFTRCAGPCPAMTQRMSELQAKMPKDSAVKLVTLTTDPAHDTPEVLKNFGRRFNADFERWMFLTGATNEIRRLAVEGLKLTALPKEEGQRETEVDLFIHSELFVVVDKNGDLRAAFESYQPDAIPQVLRAVKALLK